jgi:hypothetical protein
MSAPIKSPWVRTNGTPSIYLPLDHDAADPDGGDVSLERSDGTGKSDDVPLASLLAATSTVFAASGEWWAIITPEKGEGAPDHLPVVAWAICPLVPGLVPLTPLGFEALWRTREVCLGDRCMKVLAGEGFCPGWEEPS